MTAMYGSPRLTSGSSGACGCCGAWRGKEQIKRREERQWLNDWADELAGCICMQAWSSVTGRTCPVHGYSAPMAVTC
jgi:hypothetical protein